MCAPNVVSKDLKLWLGIDLGFVRQQQGFVRLLRVSFLRINGYDDLAIKNRARLSVENAFVELMAITVRLRMMNCGVIIN